MSDKALRLTLEAIKDVVLRIRTSPNPQLASEAVLKSIEEALCLITEREGGPECWNPITTLGLSGKRIEGQDIEPMAHEIYRDLQAVGGAIMGGQLNGSGQVAMGVIDLRRTKKGGSGDER